MSQIIPWLGSPPDALHQRAAESVIGLWVHDAMLGDSVARMQWVVDGVTDDEAETLASLWGLATSEPELTGLLLQLPWVVDMPVDTPVTIEWDLFRLLVAEGMDSPGLALLVATHPLLADDLTYEELEVAFLLIETGSANLEWARRLASLDWVSDGIERRELRLLSAVVSTAGSPTSPSEFLLSIFSLADHLTGDLRAHVTLALTDLALDDPDYLEQVTAQRWFADGLAEEEAVLVVIMERAAQDSPELFQDLLAERFTQTTTVDLPLTGRVRLWAMQNTPFPEGEALLQRMEDAVRYLEELIQEPFPTNDFIVSVVDQSYNFGYGGIWLNTHIRLVRYQRPEIVETISHEAGHFIFKGPRWYSEGASELGRAFVNHRTGVQTLDQRREQLAMDDICAHYANIRHWAYQTEELGPSPGDRCPYILGENFLLNAWNLIGQDNMSAALQELHVLDRDKEMPITEEAIYNALLTNAPADKQEAFRDLYRRLHGGPFALLDTNFDDDHGDEAADASITVPGQSLAGELDYLFDFDYFRFRALEGQKYRITVQHPSLPPDWITIYAPDGVTRDTDGWKSRSATPSGPEALWIAPTTGEYYFAVRNFGGLTGTYTLSIDPVEDAPDDHGGTPASATSLTPGQTVNGTVDDGFDLDYFRFQAEQGQWFHVEVLGETLEILSVGLYEADGATPALMRQEDEDAIINSGGNFVDVFDLKNAAWSPGASFDWIAPHAGEFLLVVSGVHGKVGSYTITITTIER